MERDGNGWVACSQGHRHWGRFGAAGLLVHTVDEAGELRLLLQHRAEWCHHGGTWGLPGGARDSHETVTEAALREAHEETAIDVAQIRVRHTFVDDHGGWSYTTVYADSTTELDTTPNEESASLEWVRSGSVSDLPLHPGFGSSWPAVRLPAVDLVVDAANVVGSVPDGWWKDRLGAAERLADDLAHLVPSTVTTEAGAAVVSAVHLVVEGRARDASAPATVRAVTASGSGDDRIVELVGELDGAGRPVVVVTSDRELRERVGQVTSGRAQTRGTRWLRSVLERETDGQRA